MVIDVRGLNKITESDKSDSYPMPLQALQAAVITRVAGYRYIAVIHARDYFHQFRVRISDRNKLTIVSYRAHRGQEQSNVALIGYKGSPSYVQRQTDKMLRPYQDSAKAYVDNIIIFSGTLAEHLEYLRTIFNLFRLKRISLSPEKSFLRYSSVILLGSHVDSLSLSTSEEKIVAIKALKFTQSPRDIEILLGLTGWLRSSITKYTQRAQALQRRKTDLTPKLVRQRA